MTDKTPTERLRELLDERGVKWYEVNNGYPCETVWYSPNGNRCIFTDIRYPRVGIHDVTPEQAVEAALGCKPDERLAARMTEVMMRVERALGVDHGGVEVLSAEVAPLLKEALEIIDAAAALGCGECHAIIRDNLTESEGTGDAWADCSECGHLLYVLTEPNSEPPNFCPNCGRRVVNA